jgi:hypothetical protein
MSGSIAQQVVLNGLCVGSTPIYRVPVRQEIGSTGTGSLPMSLTKSNVTPFRGTTGPEEAKKPCRKDRRRRQKESAFHLADKSRISAIETEVKTRRREANKLYEQIESLKIRPMCAGVTPVDVISFGKDGHPTKTTVVLPLEAAEALKRYRHEVNRMVNRFSHETGDLLDIFLLSEKLILEQREKCESYGIWGEIQHCNRICQDIIASMEVLPSKRTANAILERRLRGMRERGVMQLDNGVCDMPILRLPGSPLNSLEWHQSARDSERKIRGDLLEEWLLETKIEDERAKMLPAVTKENSMVQDGDIVPYIPTVIPDADKEFYSGNPLIGCDLEENHIIPKPHAMDLVRIADMIAREALCPVPHGRPWDPLFLFSESERGERRGFTVQEVPLTPRMDSWDVKILHELALKFSAIRYRKLISTKDCWIFESRDWQEALGNCLCGKSGGCALSCIDWKTGPYGNVCKCRVRGGGVCLQQCCCGSCAQCRQLQKGLHDTLFYWWKRWREGIIDIKLKYLPDIGRIDGHANRYNVITTMTCMNELLTLRAIEVIGFPLQGKSPDDLQGIERNFVEVEDASGRAIIIFCQRRRSDPTSPGVLLVMEAGWFRVYRMPRQFREKLKRLGVG